MIQFILHFFSIHSGTDKTVIDRYDTGELYTVRTTIKRKEKKSELNHLYIQM